MMKLPTSFGSGGPPIASSTGTVSARPETMFDKTLPFRRQLEASTAPHAAPATASAQPAHVKFAVPSAVGEEGDPLAVETSAVDKNDAAQPRDKQDTTDANPNAMAPIIVLASVASPLSLPAVPAGGAALAPTTGTSRDPAGSALPPQTTDTPANDGLQSGSRNAVRSAPCLVTRRAIDLPAPASDVAKAATATAASAILTPATPAAPATATSTAPPVIHAPTPPAIQSSAAARGEPATSAQLQNDQAARTAVTQTLPNAASATGAAQVIQANGIVGLANATPTRAAQGSKVNGAQTGESETSATNRTPAPNLASTLQRSIGDKPAPAHSNAPTAPAPAPVLAVDTSAQPVQNFAQVVAQQTAPAQASTATPQNLPTAATVPFDHNFGQRIGGAISAAMSAMSIKNGAILLQITPEGFGKLEIALDRKMERLQITTENEAVRGAIAQAHGRIEHELRQAGQRITTIDVATRDGATRHDGNGGSEQRNGQGNAQGNAQQSGGARPDQRSFSPHRSGPVRGESELQKPPANVFYA